VSFAGPNLAREPFANLRPLRRAAGVLWLAALALAGWNVAAYLSSGAGVADRAAELERLRRQSAEDQSRAETLEADLRRADLARANARTEFLNRRIDERAFSWNLLLDRLGEALPRGVRVQRLAPQVVKDDRPAPVEAAAAAPGAAPARVVRPIALQIAGEAEDDESLLEFVDRLFAHPTFDRPDLEREARTKAGTLTFSLRVVYLPGAGPAGEELAAEAAAPAAQGAAATAGPATALATAPTPAAAAPAAAAPAAAPSAPPAVARVEASGPAAGSPAADRQAGSRGVAPAVAPGSETSGGSARGAVEPAQTEPTLRPGGAPALGPAPGDEPRAPRPSIFGAPWPARPYASSGGTR